MPDKSEREKLLKDAISAITGPRDASYGDATDSFTSIARYWTAYFQARYGMEGELDATDVAIMMTLLKVSRLSTGDYTERDTWMDIAGYAGLGYEVSADE